MNATKDEHRDGALCPVNISMLCVVAMFCVRLAWCRRVLGASLCALSLLPVIFLRDMFVACVLRLWSSFPRFCAPACFCRGPVLLGMSGRS